MLLICSELSLLKANNINPGFSKPQEDLTGSKPATFAQKGFAILAERRAVVSNCREGLKLSKGSWNLGKTSWVGDDPFPT